jgi:hypothetical protein
MSELSSSVGRTPSAERTPLPGLPVTDERLVGAWCEWLGALATDAEAALAAAIAYRELTPSGRDYWLTVLEHDAKRLDVPKIALYAPLLAVESDPVRRERISDAMGPIDLDATPGFAAHALSGVCPNGTRVAVLVTPLYLNFAQVLACGYRLGTGFSWVRHDPILLHSSAPNAGDRLEGALLENTPMKAIIDDLALTVLAHRRSGGELPEALSVFADLFGPVVGGSTPPPAP